jgi:hypothetical protein
VSLGAFNLTNAKVGDVDSTTSVSGAAGSIDDPPPAVFGCGCRHSCSLETAAEAILVGDLSQTYYV